jgi:hypothetical protein
MKSKVALTLALSITLLCIALVAYSGVAFAKFTPHTFTLTVSGTAYDSHLGKQVSVVLTLTGTVTGNKETVFVLHVHGGTLTVNSYGTFAIPSGSGILVLCRHMINFDFKVTPKYGGHVVMWDLDGFAGKLVGGNVHVCFDPEHKIILPTLGSPVLYDVDLAGTLSLS